MDASSFDTLTRILGNAGSRRAALGTLLGAALGGVLAGVAAKPSHHRHAQ